MLKIDKRDLYYVMIAHMEYPRKPENRFRKCTGLPYYVHPLECAAMMLAETNRTIAEFQYDAALALVYHDVLEDTFRLLPQWLSERVVEWVNYLTLPEGGFSKTFNDIWGKPQEVRLLRLCDSTNNLRDMDCFSPEKQYEKKEQVLLLAEDAEQNFGALMVAEYARGLCSQIV